MDVGLCGLLSVKAVSLKEKALTVSNPGSQWRSKPPQPCAPVCGRNLREALKFARFACMRNPSAELVETSARSTLPDGLANTLDTGAGSVETASSLDTELDVCDASTPNVWLLGEAAETAMGARSDSESSDGLVEEEHTSSEEAQSSRSVAGCPEPQTQQGTALDSLGGQEEVLAKVSPPVGALNEPQRKKRRKKKKRKKKCKSEGLAEQPKNEKRPPVPRFPHPALPQCEQDVELLGAAATVTRVERTKERLSKHLFLGRFPKKPMVLPMFTTCHVQVRDIHHGQDIDAGNPTEAPPPAPAWGARPKRRVRSQDGGSGAAALPRPPAKERTADTVTVEPVRPVPRPLQPHSEAQSRPFVQSSTKSLLRASSCETKAREEPADLALSSLYFSYSSMRDPDGQKVPLKHREKVVRILHELNTKVALPVCRHFGMRYNFFSEHHCQAKKAGVTVKEPLILRRTLPNGTVLEEMRHLVTIRLRIRIHPTKGDPQTKFISRGTQLAVLLHELCHLKHMNHGKDFMLFLRQIFAHAQKLGIFDAWDKAQEMENEIPSPWPWENEIFRTRGDVETEELLRLFDEHRAAQHAQQSQVDEAEHEQGANPPGADVEDSLQSTGAEKVGEQLAVVRVIDDSQGAAWTNLASLPTRQRGMDGSSDDVDDYPPPVPLPDTSPKPKLDLVSAFVPCAGCTGCTEEAYSTNQTPPEVELCGLGLLKEPSSKQCSDEGANNVQVEFSEEGDMHMEYGEDLKGIARDTDWNDNEATESLPLGLTAIFGKVRQHTRAGQGLTGS